MVSPFICLPFCSAEETPAPTACAKVSRASPIEIIPSYWTKVLKRTPHLIKKKGHLLEHPQSAKWYALTQRFVGVGYPEFRKYGYTDRANRQKTLEEDLSSWKGKHSTAVHYSWSFSEEMERKNRHQKETVSRKVWDLKDHCLGLSRLSLFCS